MQLNILKVSIVVSVLFSVVLLACTRDKDMVLETEKPNMMKLSQHNINVYPPAYYITMSEKLEIPASVDLPANLPNGNSRVLTLFAEGVQKYKAQQKAGSDPATYEWVFVAPQADLFDLTNKKVGTHSAGPIWQLFENGDLIQAQHFSPAKTAPSPAPNTIDWLQLMPKVGTIPTGIFAGVSYIQRIATEGGKAPATPPTSINETIDVKYIAVYRFSKRN